MFADGSLGVRRIWWLLQWSHLMVPLCIVVCPVGARLTAACGAALCPVAVGAHMLRVPADAYAVAVTAETYRGGGGAQDLQWGGGTPPGDNFDGENFVRGNFVTPPILMQGHETPKGKFSSHPEPLVPCGQYGVPGPCSLSFQVCNWVFLAVAPHSFHFITGTRVIMYSCPTCNGWDKK